MKKACRRFGNRAANEKNRTRCTASRNLSWQRSLRMQQIKQFFFHPDYTVGRGVAPHRPGEPGSRTIPPVKNCGENAAHFALKNWENGWFFSILDLVVAIVYAKKNNLSRGNKKRASLSGKGTQTAWILFCPTTSLKQSGLGVLFLQQSPGGRKGLGAVTVFLAQAAGSVGLHRSDLLVLLQVQHHNALGVPGGFFRD